MEQESFRLLGESADVRVGVRSVDGKEIGIEVLVRLVPSGPAFDVQMVIEMLEKLGTMQGRDYRLTAQDGWWVVCEKAVTEVDLLSEGHFVLGLFASSLDRP